MVNRRNDYRFATLLVLITFIAYSPALNGGLVMDDASNITHLAGLRRIWFDLGTKSQYYPLLHSAFWLEHKAWGDSVIGYHAVNLLLHAGSALMLVAIVRLLKIKGAWLAGFLFALHPLCVESVAWISEQENTLSTFFYMAAAWNYLRFDRSREKPLYWLALLFFICALLSNSVAASLPAALLIVFWWKRGKLNIERDLRPIALFLAIGIFTAWTIRLDFTYPVIAGRAIWFYLAKVLVPFGYTLIYPSWNGVSPLWLLSVVAAIAALAWYATKNRAPLAAFLIFIVTLIPVLGFLNVWDHFLYLASPVIIVGIARLIPSRIGAVFAASLGILTFLHAQTFRSGIALYTDTIQRNPDAWLAHNKLGAELLLVPGQVPEAITHFQTAIKLRPQDPEAHYNLGSALASIKEYETALSIKEDFPEAHSNVGRELVKLPGHQAEGLAHLKRAIALNPDFASGHINLGVALSHIPGKTGEALDQLEAGVKLDPNVPGGRDALELLLSKTPGRAAESIEYFETQVRLHPDSAEYQNALANALRSEPDRIPAAILHFREALRLRPDMVDAHMNLGDTLAQFPDRQNEAILEYRYVLRLNAHFPEVHNNLGNALAASGRTAEAAFEFEAAIADDPTSAEPHINLASLYLNTPGRLNDAIQQFEAAIQLDPNLPDAHRDLGLAYLQVPGREKNVQALAQFEASLKLKPDLELSQRVEQLKLAILSQNRSFRPN